MTSETVPAYDVAIVGGGFAGAAAALVLARAGCSVLVLEQQAGHADLVRGEWLAAWGVSESRELGLAGDLDDAGSWTLRWWPRWDETVEGEAEVLDLSTFVPGVDGPMTFSHPDVCRVFCDRAAEIGARVVYGIRDLDLHVDGGDATVAWRCDDRTFRAQARFVLGAGGRAAPVGRLIGIHARGRVHHWGAGLAVRDIAPWPADCQAAGTEGSIAFHVLPQRNGRARLYLSFATEDRSRFVGPEGVRMFLDAFRLRCLPFGEAIVNATPDGPLRSRPSSTTTVETVRRGPVVLIGDEGGATDPILGCGLSSSLRDVRLVRDALLDGDPELGLEHYVQERTERMRRLSIAADFLSMLMAEFGPGPAARRAEAWRRMREDDRLGALMLANVVDPMRMPDYAFHATLRERLVGRESCHVLRTLELAGSR